MSNLTYRRGQIEWGLWQVFRFGQPGAPEGAPHAFKARIKKLLDVDREQTEKELLVDGRAFADLRRLSTSRDAEFEAFDVFCIWAALELLNAGWGQVDAVSLVRHARVQLRKEFDWIIRHHPPPSRALRLAKHYPRLPGYDHNTQRVADTHVYMLVRRADMTELYSRKSETSGRLLFEPTFVRGREALFQKAAQSFFSKSRLVIEFANAAKMLETMLERAPRITRARKQ